MRFDKMRKKYIRDVVELSLNQYNEESRIVDLPQDNYDDLYEKMILQMNDNGLGIVALESDKVIGFICGYGPIDNFFGKEKGIFIPIHGHGAVKENRCNIYIKMYQHAADIWVEQNIYSQGIAIYAHDDRLINTFFENGFGMRCVDAVATLAEYNFKSEPVEGVTYNEISVGQLNTILNMKNKLVEHIGGSPIFMPCESFDLDRFTKKAIEDKSRFFTATYKNNVVGYMEIRGSGENFTCYDKGTRNICGAYIERDYRGSGIFSGLTDYVMKIIKEEGYKRCGVDFESINPNANAFWRKNFTPYTYSLVRRIDERA